MGISTKETVMQPSSFHEAGEHMPIYLVLCLFGVIMAMLGVQALLTLCALDQCFTFVLHLSRLGRQSVPSLPIP